MLTATRPPLPPLPAASNQVVVLEDVRGSADGLVTMLADGGFRPVVGGISWNSLLGSSPPGSAATRSTAPSRRSAPSSGAGSRRCR